MRRDHRRIGQRDDVPKALLVEVGHVEHDLEPVAVADEPLARLGEAIADIGGAGEQHRHAMAEDIGAAPERAERA